MNIMGPTRAFASIQSLPEQVSFSDAKANHWASSSERIGRACENMKDPDFQKLLTAVRDGDQQAAEELVIQFEPYLRGVLRKRLGTTELQRAFDSVDICQSAMANFFCKDGETPYELNSLEDLRRLLVTIALNSLRSKSRREKRNRGGIGSDVDVAQNAPSPSAFFEEADLVEQIQSRLSSEERELFHQNKVLGLTWKEIAGQKQEATPAALRMKLTRAVSRIRAELQDESEQ